MQSVIRIGSRESRLAVKQAEIIKVKKKNREQRKGLYSQKQALL